MAMVLGILERSYTLAVDPFFLLGIRPLVAGPVSASPWRHRRRSLPFE
jgi:hypothetical protein